MKVSGLSNVQQCKTHQFTKAVELMLDFWQIEQIKLTCQMAMYLQKRHL